MMESVLVFGRGQYFQKKAELVRQKYNAKAFVDNNHGEHILGNNWDSIPVIYPSNISDYPQCNILVMVSWRLMNEVIKQLISVGVTRDRIILGINEKPLVNDTEAWLYSNQAVIEVVEDGGLLVRCPYGRYVFNNCDEFSRIMLDLYQKTDPNISFFKTISVNNSVKLFGSNRGNPIDRYYIEDFLERNSEYIHGDVGEMGELTYTEQFGQEINNKYIFHVSQKGEDIKNINLETGEGIENELLDCFICTQTIQFIYDIKSVAKNIYKLLKDDGVALITAAGISKISLGDYNQWGEYWHFTKQSMKRIFQDAGFSEIEVESYGNIKTAMCFLYGMTVEDLSEDDFELNDEQFQVIITALVKK